MSVSIDVVKDTITKRLDKMIERMDVDSRAFYSRKVYPWYQGVQVQRWQTENSSEGEAWPALNQNYQEKKLKWYKANLGSGKRMMIATSNLVGSVIGPGAPMGWQKGHVRMIKKTGMFVGTTIDYAKWAAIRRPIFSFGDKRKAEYRQLIYDYFVRVKD